MAGGATGPWKEVKGTKRRKKDAGTTSVASESVTSENRFSDLEEDFGDPGIEQQPRKQAKGKPSPSVPKKAKLPPLVVVNFSFHKLQPLVEKLGVKPIFKISGIGTKILCKTEEEFLLVENLLKQCKLEYFTHDKPGEKPFKVIVRGLPGVTGESLKKQLLVEHQLQALEVREIKRQEDSRFRDTMYLIYFPRGSITMKQLKEIRTISNIQVTWDAHRSKHDVTMCMNCLHFGHGTRHCHRASRCNRCGEAHSTEKCPAEDCDPRCANCGGKHPATDKTCGKRAEFLKIRRQATIGKQPGRRIDRRANFSANYDANFPPLNPNLAEPPKKQSGIPPGFQRTSRSEPPPSAWNSEAASSTLHTNAELMKIFVDMSNALRGCKSKFEQIQVLGTFVIQYGY